MKLQDVIPYYHGCKYLFDNKVWELFRIETTSKGVLVTGKRKEQFLKHNSMWVTECVPLLRRLEDMTEEEAITIATMAMFDKSLGYPVSDYTVRRQPMGNYPPSACRVAINNDWYDMEIAIGFNSGNIWYTKGEQRVFNQPAIFHTLLQYHFDLFGLIPANLAIDIKTL